MVKVSVLVAVYNSEPYLRQCLDSLVGQTLREIQVLCVDDASTDGSWEILREYAGKDDRVEITHLEENGGQAKARNIALRRAKGAYVCFLDSDDWLAPDSLEVMAKAFERDEETDSVLFRCRYCEPTGETHDYAMPDWDTMPGKEAFEKSLGWEIHGVYAVRAEIHKRFPYDDSSRAYSDDNTTRLHYLFSRKVANSAALYFYRQHAESVTHRVSMRRFDYLKANLSMKRQLVALGAEESLIDRYENCRWTNLVGLCLFALHHAKQLGDADLRAGILLIKEIWSGMETGRLEGRNHYKLGYYPFRWRHLPAAIGWKLFWAQEHVYYWIRKKLNRLPR